jgi:hypothetical protein
MKLQDRNGVLFPAKMKFRSWIVASMRPRHSCIHAQQSGHWLSALPKRWIGVTAPAWAVLRENPAFLIKCVAMQR